jgi:hypothetical protein
MRLPREGLAAVMVLRRRGEAVAAHTKFGFSSKDDQYYILLVIL